MPIGVKGKSLKFRNQEGLAAGLVRGASECILAYLDTLQVIEIIDLQ